MGLLTKGPPDLTGLACKRLRRYLSGVLRSDDYGYFFAFESYPGPWPLDGFVNELNGTEAEHQAVLEEMATRGLVEQVC